MKAILYFTVVTIQGLHSILQVFTVKAIFSLPSVTFQGHNVSCKCPQVKAIMCPISVCQGQGWSSSPNDVNSHETSFEIVVFSKLRMASNIRTLSKLT